MNKKIGMIGSLINAFTVFAFAVCMLIHWNFGSYFVCIFLSFSFMMMIAAFNAECTEKTKAAGLAALVFAGVYATLIVIVYFTQCTSVINEKLSADVERLLDYRFLGWLFNLDLLGYGIMALSTFFISLTIQVRNRKDKALKVLLLLHGLFFPGCLIMPMTGMFVGSDGSTSSGGVIALEFWCAFFLPIGILAALHFKEEKTIGEHL